MLMDVLAFRLQDSCYVRPGHPAVCVCVTHCMCAAALEEAADLIFTPCGDLQ